MTDWMEGRFRRDGLALITSPSTGCYIVLPADDRPALELCPCCARPLVSERAAQLVADACYPLPKHNNGG